MESSKLKVQNPKQGQSVQDQNDTHHAIEYNLEQRTFRFAQQCREFVRRVPRTISNIEDAKQLVRSSGSVAANYIEACEAISKRDFYHRMKICRKEAKESRLWLQLLHVDGDLNQERIVLANEAFELVKIFGAIVTKHRE